jgi:DNA (cytosine-5)-methyltransferase 1
MSWLFSQALVEEYLGENFSDGEQSAPLSGNPIQQAYCAPDKMTVFSRLSRFGMTYKPLTDIRGEELSMSSVVAFHVRTLVPQEKAQELTENDQECGEKWLASFTKYDPSSCSWKTHQCSLLGDLDEFLETWPQWGLMRDGECWEQRMLEQTIRGTESGLSPDGVATFHTPNTTGLDGGSNSRKALKKKQEKFPTPTSSDYKDQPTSKSWKEKGAINFKLSNPEIREKWPTPLASDWKPRGPNSKQQGLSEKVKWPTPQASDCRDRGNMSNPAIQRRAEKGKQLNLSMVAHPTSGQLNPTWVEWLMGWPLEWTDLKPLEMDKSHCVQPQPSKS